MRNLLAITVVLNAAYITAFPSASIFYVVLMLLHLGFSAALLLMMWSRFRFGGAIRCLYLVWQGSSIVHVPKDAKRPITLNAQRRGQQRKTDDPRP